MHTILIKLDNKEIKKVQYFNSKFERELGDIINFEGEKMSVGIITETKGEAISAANYLVKMQNKINRKHNKIIKQKERIEENKFWLKIINENPSIKDCFETIKQYS